MTDGTGGRRATLSCWRRRSLRARLTAAATIVIAVGMAAAAVLLVWRVHSVLTANLDANLIRQGGTNIQRGQLKPPHADSSDKSLPGPTSSHHTTGRMPGI